MLMPLRIRLLPALLLLASSFAVAVPPDFKASYELSRGSVKIGNSTLELSTGSNGSYIYRSRSRPVRWVAWYLKDKLTETSKGRITGQLIRPDSYHYLRSGGAREREARLAFDWTRMTVVNHVEGSHWKMDIPAGTLDKLAAQLGMMVELENGKTDISFQVADGGKLKQFRYHVSGKETIESPAGTFQTVRVIRIRDNSQRETVIWCAPSLHYLPVRIWQRERDDAEYRSDLESYDIEPDPAEETP